MAIVCSAKYWLMNNRKQKKKAIRLPWRRWCLTFSSNARLNVYNYRELIRRIISLSNCALRFIPIYQLFMIILKLFWKTRNQIVNILRSSKESNSFFFNNSSPQRRNQWKFLLKRDINSHLTWALVRWIFQWTCNLFNRNSIWACKQLVKMKWKWVPVQFVYQKNEVWDIDVAIQYAGLILIFEKFHTSCCRIR